MELWSCGHKHATQAEAHACGETGARAIAARALAEYQPFLRRLYVAWPYGVVSWLQDS